MGEKFGEKVLETRLDGASTWSVIEPTAIREVCGFFRSDERLSMDHLELLGGVDYKDRIEVVYVLYSMKHRHRHILKCRLSREDPRLQSVESVWKVADWHERETYDMFGVAFEGHPNLRRILCPDDWEGYPLRRDYKAPKEYLGMPV